MRGIVQKEAAGCSENTGESDARRHDKRLNVMYIPLFDRFNKNVETIANHNPNSAAITAGWESVRG